MDVEIVEVSARFGPEEKWTASFALGINPDVLNGLLAAGVSPLVSPGNPHLQTNANYHYPSREVSPGLQYLFSGPYHSHSPRNGFDEGNEIYNLEYSYQAENWSRSISTNFGRPDDASLLAEKAIFVKSGLSFYDHDKLNMSLYAKTQNGNHRQLTIPYILLGFTLSIYFVVEMDFHFFQPTKKKATQKIFDYAKLDYEPIQGLHLYWITQALINDFKRNYQALHQDLK